MDEVSWLLAGLRVASVGFVGALQFVNFTRLYYLICTFIIDWENRAMSLLR